MSRSHTPPPPAQPAVWRAPVTIGVLSAVGLVSALLGDGAWDAVSWLGLGLPTAVCLWYGWKK
ncbi:hypothetical protein V4F39_24340 [Aquincola sp. MAHUQ-54]|uniref:Uncharacterized protein n=1 Tax=Aquincola agrisoli TaxID=3119538 RepID=A0AAW9QR41_9BURK